jgi:flagellar protein FliO/FliZ
MGLIDLHQFLRFGASLTFVLALMGLLAVALRRVSSMPLAATPKKRRLKVVEILPIDARRRLAIIQRDDRQHLVILGQNGETVIESGFESKQDDEKSPPLKLVQNDS